MGKPRETFSKKETKSRQDKKRKEKEAKREERKAGKTGSSFDDMIAYVDEFGNITDTPPDPATRTKVNAEDIEINIPRDRFAEENYSVKTGTVIFFDTAKGFGFIQDSIKKQNIFVHANDLIDQIVEGNLVSYEVESSPKGLKAVNVKLVK